MKKIRSRAPLRIGLAGGGTDVGPYCDEYIGYVLNATIDMYAHCTIEITDDNTIEFISKDLGVEIKYNSDYELPFDGKLDLFKGIYNRIVKDYVKKPLSFKLITYSDAQNGSGLGGSSTLVVAIVKAFEEWLHLPLGEYDIAQLAYKIEREDLSLLGGKQDQYAATFGGFNFIEFHSDNKVIVNPLRVKNWIINELEESILICYTGISRDSSLIIKTQVENTNSNNQEYLEIMHKLKNDAVLMKEALLTGDISSFAKILDNSWQTKKNISNKITNSYIDEIYDLAKKAGALGGKVSGAGGGGFMIFIVDPSKKIDVINALKDKGLMAQSLNFTKTGTLGWTL